jgi:hypothetical protein
MFRAVWLRGSRALAELAGHAVPHAGAGQPLRRCAWRSNAQFRLAGSIRRTRLRSRLLAVKASIASRRRLRSDRGSTVE